MKMQVVNTMMDQKLFSEMISKMENALSDGKIDVFLCEQLDQNAFQSECIKQTDEYGQIIYLLNGAIECKCIDGKRKEIYANESVLIPRGMPPCIRTISSDDLQAIYVRFRTPCYEFFRCIHICDQNLRMLQILEMLKDEFKREYRSVMIRRYLLGSALLMMTRLQFEKETRLSTFDRAVMYLRVHLNEKISIDSLAQLLYVSPSYLCRLFRKQTNMTVMNYLCAMRINEAKRYLEKTNYGIEEIAFKVGFASPKYFTKKFKELVYMTPSAFRKKMNNNPQF